MSGVSNKVFEEALSLPSDERVSLVEKLLTSLNLPIQVKYRVAENVAQQGAPADAKNRRG